MDGEKKEKKDTFVFDTHKFLFTLFHEGEIKDKILVYEDKTGELKKIKIKEIEIGASPISCRIIDENGKKHIINFYRIKKVLDENENLIWENNNENLDVKIIKGYKRKFN